MYHESDEYKKHLDSIVSSVNVDQKVSARWKLRRIKSGEVVEETSWIKNVIVNGWFDYLFQNTLGSGPAGFLAGAGTATPLETDTSMQSYLGGGNDFQEATWTVNSTVLPYTGKAMFRIRAAEGAVVGNVAEVGLYYATSTTAPTSNRPLMNRMRVLDELGNPTVITVLSDEMLEVVCEITYYMITGTGTLSLNDKGSISSIPYEIRPVMMNFNQMSQVILSLLSGNTRSVFHPSGLISTSTTSSPSTSFVNQGNTFSDPSGSALGQVVGGYNISNNFTTKTLATYVPGSKARLQTIRLPLNNGNIDGGFRSIYLQLNSISTSTSWCSHQILFDSPITKVGTELFDLPVTVSMSNS